MGEVGGLWWVGGGGGGGEDWSKVFRIYNFLNGLAYFDDGVSNAIDRLSLRFFFVEGPKFVQVDQFWSVF